MDDHAPAAGVSWDTLCREYPATFGGLAGNGFYRNQWIEDYRHHIEIFARPPSLQEARRFARPIELAARLLAYGQPPETVRQCVFHTDAERHSIYAILARGNGQSADALLHLFAPTMPAVGASLLASVQANAQKICDELFDTTPAPEPSSICPDPCPADKPVKWPRPEQIDAIFNMPPQPPFTCLDRFPATTAGHIAFLEFVLTEIHLAAEAKRNQFARGYSNDNVASMVRGILWSEAADRLAAITGLPADTVEQVARVLQRELAVGTAERIEELLKPALVALRDALEDRRAEALGLTGLREQPEDAPAPIGSYAPTTGGSNPGCTHSPDFRSVKWFGVGYSFTANQAACVKLLWESWEQGCPEVGCATVLEAAGIQTERFDHVFRGHPALGKMIIPGQTKGSYRLQENPPADANPPCGS